MSRLLCALAIVLAACGGGAQQAAAPEGSQVVVELTDYKVSVSVPTVKAGSIKIGVRNLAAMEHNFEVIKSELAPDKLPIDGATAKAKDDGKVGEIGAIPPGRSASVTVNLVPGTYVLICNIAGHYQLGMRAGLTVE